MGYFDGMENQREMEIYFKKLVSAFISLSEDLLERESQFEDEKEALSVEEKPVAKYLKSAQGRI